MSDPRLELERVPSPDESSLVRPGYPRLGGYPDASAYGYGYGYPEDDERAYLRRMWRAIKKRKLVIITIAVIVTSVVTVEVYRTKSTYQASTTVEIGKDSRTLIRTGDTIFQTDEGDDLYFVQMAMKTRIRQLQSRPLLEVVFVNLKLDQNARVMEINSRRSIIEAIKSALGRLKAQEQWTPPAILQTPTATSSPERSRQESARLAPYVDVLAANLSADPLPDTRMLVISFTHTDPVLAAEIVDNVAQVFIKRTFENKTERYTSASEWLDKSTRELKSNVEKAEKELADYSGSHNIYSSDAKENLSVEKLTKLHGEVTRTQTERLLKQSLYEEVKAGRVAQLPDAFSDPRMNELKKRLGELAVTLSQQETTFGPKNPKMIDPPQVPRSPVAPNRPRTILIGFLVSLLAGVGLVFVLEYLDNTVKTVEDVSRFAQLPALSVIPAIRGRKQRALKAGNNGSKRAAAGRALAKGNGFTTEHLVA